jgi:hypothetical protein
VASNETVDEAQARAALASAERAGGAARQAGRRWARRYLLAFGAAASLAMIAVWAIHPWVSNPALWFGFFVVLILLVSAWLRRQPLQAKPRRLVAWVLIPAWGVVFGLTMAVAPEFPVAYPIGAVVGFAVWAAGAWWVGRGGRVDG